MRIKNLLWLATASVATVLFFAGPRSRRSQTPGTVALTGQVTSADEGPMEGVLVTAKMAGSVINTTVVTDQSGRYSFPRAKLEPGSYTLRIRAAGYAMDDPGKVEVTAGQPATADLKLQKTHERRADFWTAVNLSTGPAGSDDLKTLPRPKGSNTRVIITEYDLPRKLIEPHDVILDADGMVWYSSFGEQAVGRMDPKTGKLTEFNIPVQKPG